jgi:hypothetical protein
VLVGIGLFSVVYSSAESLRNAVPDPRDVVHAAEGMLPLAASGRRMHAESLWQCGTGPGRERDLRWERNPRIGEERKLGSRKDCDGEKNQDIECDPR